MLGNMVAGGYFGLMCGVQHLVLCFFAAMAGGSLTDLRLGEQNYPDNNHQSTFQLRLGSATMRVGELGRMVNERAGFENF